MTTIDVLKNKISETDKYLETVKKYQIYSKEKILQDVTLRGAVERYLYLLCQSAIDLGEAIISYHNLRSPSTYAEIFEILNEKELISGEVALEMEKMAGFRNILAHAYGKTDFAIVYQVLTQDIKKIAIYINRLRKKLNL